MSQERILTVKFAGRLIDLLGQQMYGGPVPSVAELVANAWDADATKVEITIPEELKADSEIIVKDYGVGMTFEELNDFYLNIGYERRKRGESSPGGRPVMGRKGIGKLAGFGIAEDIVLKSVKDGHLVEFTLNYDALRNLKTAQNFAFSPDRDEDSDEPNGVTVTFKRLKLKRNLSVESFRKSMARRFALSAEKMQILVNNIALTKEGLDFDFRIPDGDGWVTENVDGFGEIKYWFGFLKSPITEAEMRGVSVFARDRVAQFTPFVFNLSGGINGQVALEYLTGQVIANGLDEGEDLIATDRQTVNWQFEKAQILEIWGKEKIKTICAEWKKRHEKKNVDRFANSLGEFYKRIDNLSSLQEKKDLTAALTKIATIERIGEEDFRVIAGAMISGVERESVKKVIQKINASSDEALPELYEVLKEWDIISAVATAEVVYGRIKIIDQFKDHIDNRLAEKAKRGEMDMQTFIKNYPWLLGHQYEQLKPADFHHEKGLDKWIEDVLIDTNKEYSEVDKRDGRRFDLLCIKNDWSIIILELMIPGKAEDYDHVMRLNRYVTRIQAYINDNSANEHFRGKSVFGLLIADMPTKDPSLGATKNALRTNLESITWDGLFSVVRANYREYYDLLKKKSPDDPRLQGLVNLDKDPPKQVEQVPKEMLHELRDALKTQKLQVGNTGNGEPVFKDPNQKD